MKKLLLLVSFSICCVTASAQPTSFGGITPGQTTREEMKSLVKDPSELDKKSDVIPTFVDLKQPDGQHVSVMFHNDIVYEVSVAFRESFTSWNELKPALIEKYGRPRIKVGGIRTVTCRNKLGATFQRLDGREELRWPVKDGVQGAITRWAPSCTDSIDEQYELRHVATVKAKERAEVEQERKEKEEKRRKLGDRY